MDRCILIATQGMVNASAGSTTALPIDVFWPDCAGLKEQISSLVHQQIAAPLESSNFISRFHTATVTYGPRPLGSYVSFGQQRT
jgi:hypothetical protein